MTGMAGMAFLMEGSTLHEGKYQHQIRKAVDWFIRRSQPNGLLGDPNNNLEMGRYMYGHGYGLMFLACAYGEEDDPDRRIKLQDVLTRAVKFTAKSQSSTGGWNYVSGADTGDDAGHEGSVTIVQVQSCARPATRPSTSRSRSSTRRTTISRKRPIPAAG